MKDRVRKGSTALSWSASVLVALALSGLAASSDAAAAPSAQPALLPQPLQYSPRDGDTFGIDRVEVVWAGRQNALLRRAAARFLDDLKSRHPTPHAPGARSVRLRIDCRTTDGGYLTVEQKEAYVLSASNGAIRLEADGPSGVLHGLATLRQAIQDTPDGPGLAPFEVTDAPRFRWRGVMIDVARHFVTLETLKRQIDAMELVKLNVLHLHLSDNEGFRVESRLYPKLQTEGSHGQFYTQDDIRDLVAYARDRDVRIVPEFDVPGHTLAILTAYPELASGPLAGVNYISAMNSALNPARPETFVVLDRLLAEMGALFPDRYIHVGGDEVTGAHWAANVQITDFMKRRGLATKADLEGYFHQQLARALHRRGKIVMGWEETGRFDTGRQSIIQVWRGSGAVAGATSQGHPVVVSAGYYLDLLDTAEKAYLNDPQDPTADGLSPADAQAARKHPIFGPRLVDVMIRNPALTMTARQKALVLGGETALWSELVTDEMVDQRLWPRAAAVAERFWSPGSVRDVIDLERRLAVTQHELRRNGLLDEAHRLQMMERLAPGDVATVATFLQTVAPVRNHAHNHLLRSLLMFKPAPPQTFDQLADIATPDAVDVWALNEDIAKLLKGDQTRADAIRARLVAWRKNANSFLALASGTTTLQTALPIAADVAELSGIGLEAVDMLIANRRPTDEWRTRANAVLARQNAARQASATMLAALTSRDQPPADLIITIAPGVQNLVEALKE